MASDAVEELQRIKQREAEIAMFRETVREAVKELREPLLDQRRTG